MNPAAERSARIRERARTLGFSHVGIARADALDIESARLHEWLLRGYHADMDWMARDPRRRSDPREVLPGAASVVCLAMNYYTPGVHSDDPRHGKISRYAWGSDYHAIVGDALAALENEIREVTDGAETRRYVDTGPVMEKAWAVRAGIGWLGKHSNVITRDRGSWVFLGEILTTADLEYDAPIPDFCGSCTACIDACPTQAIVEPYVVDAHRCISYLTIEHRGAVIPGAKDADFRGWVFGCDICQDVCPWNSFAQESPESGFAPRSENMCPELEDMADIPDEVFRERFRKSPVKRCKPDGLRRNARTVLAQQESYTDR
ncbi:MAG: tRNA epoxyqueuosine(34) reductase QueG [Bacteroidetes bacterium]|nr:tRNA epoxyqueuosine(34) reductase QueG [Bacteroidota bacterium]